MLCLDRFVHDVKLFLSHSSDKRKQIPHTRRPNDLLRPGIPQVRVLLDRKRNEDEDAADKLYTHVSVVHVQDFKGLQTTLVKEE
jgi:hypothetical protein